MDSAQIEVLIIADHEKLQEACAWNLTVTQLLLTCFQSQPSGMEDNHIISKAQPQMSHSHQQTKSFIAQAQVSQKQNESFRHMKKAIVFVVLLCGL